MNPSSFPHLIAFILRCSSSTTLAYIVAQYFGLPYPVWAAISAIVVSQEQFSETRLSIIRRFMGTIIGILIGIAVHSLVTPFSAPMALQIGLSVALAAPIAYGRPAFRAALWTGPIVLLTATPDVSILFIGLHRGCEVVLGGVMGGGFHFVADKILTLTVPKKNAPETTATTDE